MISIDTGFDLLCLAIIQKCQLLTVECISNEISKYNSSNNDIISSYIYNEIISRKINNLYKYQQIYESIINNDLMFLDHYGNFSTRTSLKKIEIRKKTNLSKKKNIDNYFWEGFDINM